MTIHVTQKHIDVANAWLQSLGFDLYHWNSRMNCIALAIQSSAKVQVEVYTDAIIIHSSTYESCRVPMCVYKAILERRQHGFVPFSFELDLRKVWQ